MLIHMSRRKLSEENIRNIQKSNRSYYVTLPIEYIRTLKWQDRQKIIVKKEGKRLVIEDWKE